MWKYHQKITHSMCLIFFDFDDDDDVKMSGEDVKSKKAPKMN
jgi:hypothetical protein